MSKRFAFGFFGLGILLLGLLSAVSAQQINSLAEVATGEGTLVIENGPSVQIKAVAVFLRDNGEAEIWIMTQKENMYAAGHWVRSNSAKGAFDLEITDDTQGRRASGCGTVFLQKGCAPVASLTMIVFRSDGTSYDAAFVAGDTPCADPAQVAAH